jgi:phage N-6-adenine-methyltransferase
VVSTVLFSSNTTVWETPQKLYTTLNNEFYFDLDPAASKENAKCKTFFTEEQDGLIQPWYDPDKLILSVFVNCPYGKQTTGKWVEKMYAEAVKGAIVVALLPARTDTKWFHKYILPFSGNEDSAVTTEIRFYKGRVQFEIDGKPVRDKKGRGMRAPFPSMVVIFRPNNEDNYE